MGEVWTEVSQYNIKTDFVDSDYNYITNKIIDSTHLPDLYLGEKNSVAITFVMDRYQNGIDFSSTSKKLYIAYSVSGFSLISPVVNVYTSDTNRIKFTWIPNEYVTRFTGTVKFSIKFKGTNTDSTESIWSSGDAVLKIENVVNPYIVNDEDLLNSFTLYANSWVASGNEFIYTVQINGVTEKNQAVLSTVSTGDGYITLRDADIYKVECGVNCVNMYASGLKPTIDTVVKIVIQ